MLERILLAGTLVAGAAIGAALPVWHEHQSRAAEPADLEVEAASAVRLPRVIDASRGGRPRRSRSRGAVDVRYYPEKDLVDHPPRGTKDVADGVQGAVFNALEHRVVWSSIDVFEQGEVADVGPTRPRPVRRH